MKSFLVKIANKENVDLILGKKTFTHSGIYNFESDLDVGSRIFFVFGGDQAQVDWTPGLVGYGKVVKKPYDKGYDAATPRYFKIDIEPEFVLSAPIPPKEAKLHPKYRYDLWEVPYVGANHFPTQAIQQTDDHGTATLLKLLNEHSNVEQSIPFDIDDIISEGSFLSRNEIEGYIDRLYSKKNLILQGPPGTGKTWLAKRLAYALGGKKNSKNIHVVQFHANLSYEDFVRGWRPTKNGSLTLSDGIFIEAVNAAINNPNEKYFVIIEEINRGNPSQIFGELLTLLEDSKRNSTEAINLSYRDEDGASAPVYIPENLYVIGTMNIADRSLALVDLALRRRFAFVTLEPKFGEVWRKWVIEKCNLDEKMVADIEGRITRLNTQIASHPRLGEQFCIGQSYITPSTPLVAGSTKKWFRQVVDTELTPLLHEYWFDDLAEAQKAIESLIKD